MFPAAQRIYGRCTDAPRYIIQPTVVMTFKSEEFWFTGFGPCYTESGLYRLGTIQAEAHQLSRGDELVEFLRKFDFFQVLPCKQLPLCGIFLYSSQHGGVGMPHDQRALT